MHILDFDEDIYGCDLVVEFVQYLRPEARFDNWNDLVAQIHLDIEQARGILDRQEAFPRPLFPIKCLLPAGERRPILYEELSYTADVGIRAYGRDPKELFVNAAYGMFSLVSDLDGLVATTQHRIEASCGRPRKPACRLAG